MFKAIYKCLYKAYFLKRYGMRLFACDSFNVYCNEEKNGYPLGHYVMSGNFFSQLTNIYEKAEDWAPMKKHTLSVGKVEKTYEDYVIKYTAVVVYGKRFLIIRLPNRHLLAISENELGFGIVKVGDNVNITLTDLNNMMPLYCKASKCGFCTRMDVESFAIYY